MYIYIYIYNVTKLDARASGLVLQLDRDFESWLRISYIYIYTYIHTYIHTHIHIHTYIHTYMHMHMCVYIYIYMYMLHTYTRVCMYKQTILHNII